MAVQSVLAHMRRLGKSFRFVIEAILSSTAIFDLFNWHSLKLTQVAIETRQRGPAAALETLQPVFKYFRQIIGMPRVPDETRRAPSKSNFNFF